MPAKQASTAKAAPKKEEKPKKAEGVKKAEAPKKAAPAKKADAPKKPAAAAKKAAAPKAPGAKKEAPKRPAGQAGKAPAKKAKTDAPRKPTAPGAKKAPAKKGAVVAPISKGIKKGAAATKKAISAKAAQLVKAKKEKARPQRYTIDCTHPVDDHILDPASFEKFLHDKFKLSTGPLAKPGVLQDQVTIGRDKAKIHVALHKGYKLSKFYLKYLTKKYLKSQQLRDWLRVISTNASTYELRYYNIQENEESDAESEDES